MIFNYKKTELEKIKGFDTLNEINHQPIVWSEVIDIVQNQKKEIQDFINKELTSDCKIIFTGAGTSEFSGNSIVNYFIGLGLDAISIPTTNIVSNIEEYINPNKKTILVSFARSGNSPESVATFDMATEYVKDLKHIVITCNKNGALALRSKTTKGNLIVLLPEKSNDKSFAMTSSYTGMMLTAYLVLTINNFDESKKMVKALIQSAEKNMNNHHLLLEKIAKEKHDRIVYLGSGNLNGIAQESHLKMLELTAGDVATFFNTPLGFRHGPKSILNKKSIVFILLNKDEYKRKYDIDLINELHTQKQIDKLVVIDYKEDLSVKKNCDYYINYDFADSNNLTLGINYVSFAQLYAFYKSVSLNKTPDNPWPSGEVNRVVQGVIIHKK